MIAERRSAGREDDGDLLSILLAARDVEGDGTGMTDTQVRDEALTLITAGHETTANGLNWAWYLLALHPEVEARFHAELDDVLGDGPSAADDAARLPYTEAVLLEAMRLYPPAWGIERRAVADQAIGGHVIPAGAAVLMPTFVMHRDPRFFPDPLRFDPDRFLPDGSASGPDWAYPLFGGGTRKCIGVGLRDARGHARPRGARTAVAAPPRPVAARRPPGAGVAAAARRPVDAPRAAGRVNPDPDAPGPAWSRRSRPGRRSASSRRWCGSPMPACPRTSSTTSPAPAFGQAPRASSCCSGWPISLAAVALVAVAADRLLASAPPPARAGRRSRRPSPRPCSARRSHGRA